MAFRVVTLRLPGMLRIGAAALAVILAGIILLMTLGSGDKRGSNEAAVYQPGLYSASVAFGAQTVSVVRIRRRGFLISAKNRRSERCLRNRQAAGPVPAPADIKAYSYRLHPTRQGLSHPVPTIPDVPDAENSEHPSRSAHVPNALESVFSVRIE